MRLINVLPTRPDSDAIMPLALMVAGGAVVFAIGALVLRMPEWRWAIGRDA